MSDCQRFLRLYAACYTNPEFPQWDEFLTLHLDGCPACALAAEVISRELEAPLRKFLRDAEGLGPCRLDRPRTTPN